MANKRLFRSHINVPATNTTNEAGGVAYSLEATHALAQYAATGCLNGTFYAGASQQLDKVLELCAQVDPTFIAKTAIYARERGYMKDMPALLVAHLAAHDGALCERVFDRVIDNGKLLRNFVQIIRSGVTGRRSLGSRPKRLVQGWLDKRSHDAIFRASVGNDPSLADILKMVHPKPKDAARRALYGYLIGRPYDVGALPQTVKDYEAYKADRSNPVPKVSFQMLTSLELDEAAWRSIAADASWQMTRMNLNTFARHGVFKHRKLTRAIARRLSDPEQIRRARVFPYQLMVAHTQVSSDVPRVVKTALHEAMEVAISNVPRVEGKAYVLPDISGSMHSPVTGYRPGATSAVRCIDVAALIGAAFLHTNPSAEIIPFSDRINKCALKAKDSVLANAKKLSSLPSGGTDCAAPLRHLNSRRAKGDLVVFVSDNESWIDRRVRYRGTAVMEEWAKYKRRNPQAKLVCVDIQPYGSTQAPERDDILNIGGFSDAVFNIIAAFAGGTLHPDHWVGVINGIEL